MTAEQRQRWESICYAYVESVRLGGMSGDDQAMQVLKSLAAIRDGLETIRREISAAASQTGMENLADRAGEFGQELLTLLQRTSQTLEQNAQRVPDQKVIVQHSVPRTMTELIRSQYQLLYDGLKHLLAESNSQSATMQRLREALSDMLTQYSNLQAEIESAEPIQTAAELPPDA